MHSSRGTVEETKTVSMSKFCLKSLFRGFTLQVYFYSFDVFRAAGIQEQQLRYAALGTGLCELTTSVACVSPNSLISHHVLHLFYGLLVSMNF